MLYSSSCGGGYFSINKENIVLSFRKFRYAPIGYIVIAFVDTITKEAPYNCYINKMSILLGVVASVIIASWLIESGKFRVNQTLANASFFVFALHSLFIGELGKITFSILHIPDNNPYAMLTLYFSVPIITILICLGLYVALKRYTPTICNLLSGGR